jgi:hypothetical protein
VHDEVVSLRVRLRERPDVDHEVLGTVIRRAEVDAAFDVREARGVFVV